MDAHGEDDSSAQDQSGKTWHGSGPEGKDAFILEDFCGADKAVFVVSAGLEGLHSISELSN